MADTVDFWVGLAKNKSALKAFLKEQYKDDALPISKFAETQGEQFYDHDFLESEFTGVGLSLSEALYYVSYSSSFSEELVPLAEGLRFNFFIASFSDDFGSPKSASVDGIELRYLGRFAYDRKAGVVGNFEHLGEIFIHLLDGKKVQFEGAETDCIRVDAYGLMIGRENPYGRSVDISGLVPAVADNQLRISVNSEGIWELRDFGNNGLSRLGTESFDDEKAMPWPGITFSVGDLQFLWSDQPKG